MSGFVYIWMDRSRKMFYVGSHCGNENDGYVSSSFQMMTEYRSRPCDFKRRILERVTGDRRAVRIAERRWLSMITLGDLGVRYYNLKRRAEGGNTFEGLSKEKMQQIGNAIRLSHTGKKHTDARKQAISAAMLGKKKSATACKAMSDARRGRTFGPLSEDHRRAVSHAVSRHQSYRRFNLICDQARKFING